MAGAQYALSTPSPPSSSSFVAATMNESHLRSSCRRKLDISSSISSPHHHHHAHAHSHHLLRPHEQSRSSSSLSPSSSSSSAAFSLKKKILHNLPSSHFFFAWEARSHLGSSLRYPLDWKKICRRKSRRVVQASLFGVGAPEALVIGVVALLVFGPKGLAEVARTLGKSLRSFQPTLKELQQISKDFKDTLEQEIGLDELRESNPSQPVYKSPTKNESVEQKAYSTEGYLRVTEDQARALVPEEQRKAAEAAAWGGAPPAATEQVQISSDVEIQTSEQTQVPSISNLETEQKTQAEVPPISKVETQDEVPPNSKVKIEQDAQAEGASKVAN